VILEQRLATCAQAGQNARGEQNASVAELAGARRNWQTRRGEDFSSMLHSLITRMSGLRSDLVIMDKTSSSIFRKY
jgi:hypothetical protein